MRRSETVLFCIIWLCFFFLTFIWANLLYAAKAKSEKWSFDFENCTISEALRQVTDVTGIYIFTNKDKDKSLFRKSFEDETIERILTDLFRKKSCAMIWCYSDEGLDSVGIWVFEGSGGRGKLNAAKFVEERIRTARGNTPEKKTGHQSRVVRRPSERAENNVVPFPPQGKVSSLTHAISERGKTRAASGPTPRSPELGISETSGREAGLHKAEQQDETQVPPTPAPEKRYVLEPPPMPPGFSHKK